jgi:cytochrome c biogenesis protein CcmG/thiol:disulfide interchange protein DsbE
VQGPSRSRRGIASLAAAAVLAVPAAGCGGGDEPESAARSAAELKPVLSGAPVALRRIYSRPNEILTGGVDAFERQLEDLRGSPVVVNKWASWCGPCRFEFPFFQRQARRRGGEVAFIGVDSRDSMGDAKRFLDEYPVPYPSFFDPKGDIAKVFRGDRVAPTTSFYDGRGELVYTKQGGYDSEAALSDDIKQYAR